MSPAVVERSAVGRRLRQRLLFGFVMLMLLGYVRQLSAAPMIGEDFHGMLAAAQVLREGGNPYDFSTLGKMEIRLYDIPGNLTPDDARYYHPLPFPEGPWLAIMLLPLTWLPVGAAYAVFETAMMLALALAAWLALERTDWAVPRRRLALLAIMLSPLAFLNLFQGQVSPLVFLSAMAGWWLAGRGRPVLAAIALSLVWIKPHLGLALPVVIAALEPQLARRLLLNFLMVSVAALAVAVAVLRAGIFEWPASLVHFWTTVRVHPWDVASLQAFTYTALPPSLAPLGIGLLALALTTYTWRLWYRCRDARERGLTLLILWFCLLPYVHSYDAVLLLPVMLLLLGPWDRAAVDPWAEAALWAGLTLPLFFFAGFHLGAFNGFTAVPVTLLLLAWWRRLSNRSQANRIEARAA